MKLSPLILSVAVAGVAADRLGGSSRTSRAASADRTAMTHRHLKEEEVGTDGVGQCGQCKKADDCLPNYECVGATESGCFNFDVSGMAETYCVPGPTDAPTVPVTEEPTVTPAPTAADATTVAPTDADVLEPTAAPTVAGTTSPPTVIIPANSGSVATCGQCEDTSDCSEGHLCVAASASGCFNFDVSGDDNMYCAPVFTPSGGTESPTSAPSAAATTAVPTSAPSAAATTAVPTSAPSEAATTTAPTAAATTTAPTSAVTSTATSGPTVAGTSTTPSPTPEPTVGTIRFIGGDPDIQMRVCEGDCDGDDECEGNLVCMQRSGDEPIPGCGGSPREAADYCILPAGRSSVVAAAQEAPSSGAVAVGTRRLATIASCVAIAGAAVFAVL